MRRRVLVLTIALCLAAPLAAEVQQAEKIWRIGFLGPSPSTGGLMQAFQQGLRELGYIERKECRHRVPIIEPDDIHSDRHQPR
jgi:putative tryptophan/tyrosine transport system substrate-binding protein